MIRNSRSISAGLNARGDGVAAKAAQPDTERFSRHQSFAEAVFKPCLIKYKTLELAFSELPRIIRTGLQESLGNGDLQTAKEMSGYCDLYKAEFPADISFEKDHVTLRRYCDELNAATVVPWVILSAGADIGPFSQMVEMACQAGASGFLAVVI